VLENAFLHILRGIEGYNPDKERLTIWMYKIARNAAINFVRFNNYISTLENQQKKSSERIANLEIDNYGLKKVIMKLKAEQKILLSLCYFKGYTYDEIAEALNIPVETVGTKLRAALLDLKAALM